VASHSSIWDSWPIAFSGHQAAVWIANLIQYKREGFKPDRDTIVALTADEEGGGPYNGVDWLLKNHRDLIDAELALNEGGWGEESKGKKISNDLQVSEKYVLISVSKCATRAATAPCRSATTPFTVSPKLCSVSLTSVFL
jgi:acetylornithine deacetylase/succinyl-diaminopimelate desuccinylase-like protein